MNMCKIIFPTINFKVEKWKWNKEYRVYVSTLGNFKDEYKRNIPIKIRSRSGYCAVMTACGYKVVHRLVLLTFRPIPNAESLTVDHLNHNKRDNSLNNLEWVTKEENRKRACNDLYIDEFESNLGWIHKQIQVNGRICKDMDAAIDYAISCMGNNGTTPNRGKVEHKILYAIRHNIPYLRKTWKIVNKKKGE